ncbi:uncharacterized protein LOC100176832 [Ciona intestinalis]
MDTVEYGSNTSLESEPSIKWLPSLELAKQELYRHEVDTMCSFTIRKKKKTDADKRRLQWDKYNIPFFAMEFTKYKCTHGKGQGHRDRRNPALPLAKKHMRVKKSRKQDCKAYVTIRKIIKFPQFQVAPQQQNLGCKKKLISKFIKTNLDTNKDLVKCTLFQMTFPDAGDHHGHEIGKVQVGTITNLNRLVLKYLKEIIAKGNSSVPELKQLVDKYVVEELFKDRTPPPPTNRIFYPTDHTIRNHLYMAYVKATPHPRRKRKPKKGSLQHESSNTDNFDILIDATEIIQDKSVQTNRMLELMDSIKEEMYNVTSIDALVQAEDLLQTALQVLKNSCLDTVVSDEMDATSVQGKRKMFPISNGEGPQSKFQKMYEDILVCTSQPQVFTSDSDQLTLHTNPGVNIVVKTQDKRKSKIPKKRSSTKIVPLINLMGRNVNQPLLKVGQDTLSYVQLMTLEKSVNVVDRKCLRSFDETFQVGKLCDNIINSYLWQLTSRYDHVIYADTSVGYMIRHGQDVGQLWENIIKCEKSYAFIPWKSNGQYWVMLAINIKDRKLLYLDPNQTDDINKTQQIYEAKEFINRSLADVLGFSLTSSATNVHKPNKGDMSSGIYVCMYAYWLTRGMSLVQPHKPVLFRKHIFDTIVGNCTLGFQNKDNCKVCHKNIRHITGNSTLWVECSSCQQWYHAQCVGMSEEQLICDVDFSCPRDLN